MPIFKGLLQGIQNFGGLGCVFIFDGLIRFSAVAVLVVIFKYQAAGGMAAALTGNIVALGIGAWLTRKIWRGPLSPFHWKTWLGKVGPLTIGSGCVLIMSIADTVFIQSVFPNTHNYLYMAGSMIGFALIQFTAPLAVVMFPKIARSVARSQQSNALKMTLEGTLLLGGLAALGCTFLPELPLRIIYFRNPDDYIPAAPLVPWFCWCMLFMSLANALVSNLLAREKFGFILILLTITTAYGLDLFFLKNQLLSLGSFPGYKTVIQILSMYNVTLFGVAAWYSWRVTPKNPSLERTGGN
jgi:O-antigen/teichoic acid export membrane protein